MQPGLRLFTTVAAALSLAVAACSSPGAPAPPTTAVATGSPAAVDPAASPTPIAMKAQVAAATATAPPPTAAPTLAATAASVPATGGTIHYAIVADGTSADYRVREQLVRLTTPSDAVGKTSKVTGSLVLGSDGQVKADQSKFAVDLTSLQSDSSMRDGYIGRGTLNLASFPTAVFVPTSFQSLPAPLPTDGSQSFQMVGNLTLHGVTKPATWTVKSAVSGGDVTGTATTAFTFEDFGMTPPKSMAILSVVDSVTLELTFHLARSA